MNDIKHIFHGYICSNRDGIHVFWEKVNKSLGVPCTRRDTKKCIPLAYREDERRAVRCQENCDLRIGDLVIFLAQILIVKPPSLVDKNH